MSFRYAAALFFMLIGAPAWAQDVKPIALDLAGIEKPAVTLTRESLAAFPVIEQDITFKTSKGEERGHYKGVLLWDVLAANGLGSLPGHNDALKHTFVVIGGDDYAIHFSAGEVMPDFGDKAVMLATEVDGKPYGGEEGLRVVVPGDKRGARAVKDVVRIEVR